MNYALDPFRLKLHELTDKDIFSHIIIFREIRVEPTKEVEITKTIACAPSQYLDLEVTGNNHISLEFTMFLLMVNTIGSRRNIMIYVGEDKSTMNIA